MGDDTSNLGGLIGQLIGAGISLLGDKKESKAAEQQSQDEQVEVQRQQVQATEISQGEKSDRAIAADRQIASMTVAMETLGGAGSQNEARLGREIAGVAALDIARIEGNRRRQVEALESQATTSRNRAEATKTRSKFNSLGTLVDLGGKLAEQGEERARQSRAEDLARGRTPLPL
jgi:hypothetical protein